MLMISCSVSTPSCPYTLSRRSFLQMSSGKFAELITIVPSGITGLSLSLQAVNSPAQLTSITIIGNRFFFIVRLF